MVKSNVIPSLITHHSLLITHYSSLITFHSFHLSLIFAAPARNFVSIIEKLLQSRRAQIMAPWPGQGNPAAARIYLISKFCAFCMRLRDLPVTPATKWATLLHVLENMRWLVEGVFGNPTHRYRPHNPGWNYSPHCPRLKSGRPESPGHFPGEISSRKTSGCS